ncbi:antibiotic biosynthesis monooxygenase family protein [Streptomyces sp. ICBB 8177]|uniref:antibiotic biosynthesis monooxygenase family protein n=1 Tax=Streptomyces sp. ICBB 8177 TaxID=563922 RepID=UPI000D68209C|nr:antibiotic biosynthesis monooxygenase family protein [Streptomyces sp. ICBB 8177]PWI41887.1 hypothetical protein CK485_24135 [Streptomyces sp. ICBB 8177]
MIVRVWEAPVVPGLMGEFCAMMAADVVPPIRQVDGCLGAELLCSTDPQEPRVLLVSRWRDEAALRGYAGPMWRVRPVWAEQELRYLLRAPRVSHFTPQG